MHLGAGNYRLGHLPVNNELVNWISDPSSDNCHNEAFFTAIAMRGFVCGSTFVIIYTVKQWLSQATSHPWTRLSTDSKDESPAKTKSRRHQHVSVAINYPAQ